MPKNNGLKLNGQKSTVEYLSRIIGEGQLPRAPSLPGKDPRERCMLYQRGLGRRFEPPPTISALTA